MQRQQQQQNSGIVVLHVAPPSAEELAHSAALEQVRTEKEREMKK